MKATKEQIIAEANRRWDAELWPRHKSVIDHVIDIMCENWTPPEPVDPDLLAFRKWFAAHAPNTGERILAGEWDQGLTAVAYLAGARMATEREQERANGLDKALHNAARYSEKQRQRAENLVEALDKIGAPRAVAAIAKYRGEA